MWTLIVYIYAGILAHGDSVALTNVEGFKNKVQCETAGKGMSPLVSGSAKELRFVCVEK